MLEDPSTPTFLSLSAPEWHALEYGLLEGVKFWKRREVPESGIDALDIGVGWKADLHAKYHYYRFAFDLPEDLALLALVIYYGTTNLPLLVNLAGKFLGGLA